MKITKLIEVFEKLLPIYKGCKINKYGLPNDIRLVYGLCHASKNITGVDISGAMKGYYRNLLNYGAYLFPPAYYGTDMKMRIDFMESEIKDLKRLLKKGYTHI